MLLYGSFRAVNSSFQKGKMPDQVTISVRQTRKVVRHTPVHYQFSHAPLKDKFYHTSVYFSQTWSDDRL